MNNGFQVIRMTETEPAVVGAGKRLKIQLRGQAPGVKKLK